MNVPQWLETLGVPQNCVSPASSATERRRSFSIRPQGGDQIWRVHLDGCWLQSSGEKKVDYLFWGQSVSGRKVVLLVELKGKAFGEALKQVEGTLRQLCKRAVGRGIHTGSHQKSPGHNPHDAGGVRAYVVLSRGRGVPQRQSERERIRQKYGVVVYPKSQRLEVHGLDTLP